MTIATEDVPPATGVCQTTTAMDLAWMQLGDGQFLLPKRSSQRFVYPMCKKQRTLQSSRTAAISGESTINFAASR